MATAAIPATAPATTALPRRRGLVAKLPASPLPRSTITVVRSRIPLAAASPMTVTLVATAAPRPRITPAAMGTYFTDESFAFTEEFSVFLMVVLTFVGASAAFAKNSHIRMSFVVEKLQPRIADRIEIAVMAAAAALFAIIVWYGIRLFLDDWKFDTTSPGIGIPQWIYTIWLPLLR